MSHPRQIQIGVWIIDNDADAYLGISFHFHRNKRTVITIKKRSLNISDVIAERQSLDCLVPTGSLTRRSPKKILELGWLLCGLTWVCCNVKHQGWLSSSTHFIWETVFSWMKTSLSALTPHPSAGSGQAQGQTTWNLTLPSKWELHLIPFLT